jgi:hypothetical protein
MFWRTLLLPLSGLKRKPSESQLFLAALLSLLFDPEERGRMFLQNVTTYHHIPGDNHGCENPKSRIKSVFTDFMRQLLAKVSFSSLVKS